LNALAKSSRRALRCSFGGRTALTPSAESLAQALGGLTKMLDERASSQDDVPTQHVQRETRRECCRREYREQTKGTRDNRHRDPNESLKWRGTQNYRGLLDVDIKTLKCRRNHDNNHRR
jgi:hypothetical protein